jgi:hypothetical protein
MAKILFVLHGPYVGKIVDLVKLQRIAHVCKFDYDIK